ncbi:hypothetical protein KY332_01165 [Candidatus Woesearchaeota archaeon]|nr:hypothetical protein [Candidatus Woesearchaeota archaeon]
MTDDYKPNLADIVKQMGKDSRYIPAIALAAGVGLGIFAYESIRDFGKSFLDRFFSPYALPTVVRHLNEDVGNFEIEEGILGRKLVDKKNLSMSAQAGDLAGIVGLVIQGVGSVGFALDNDCPEVFLIPLATNVLSGVYEWGRKTRNDLITYHNCLSSLEKEEGK